MPGARPTAHRFGGDWTTAKLTVVGKYLQSYATALKDKPSKARPFAKAYVDAFAGTGYRNARERSPRGTSRQLLFPDLASGEPQALLAGSARVALETKPPFDRYIFIERVARRCAQLAMLKLEFPALAPRISVRRREANQELLDLCAKGKDW